MSETRRSSPETSDSSPETSSRVYAEADGETRGIKQEKTKGALGVAGFSVGFLALCLIPLAVVVVAGVMWGVSQGILGPDKPQTPQLGEQVQPPGN